ncbi:MAG TPA: RNA polymerase sigma factor [Polyangia bacterium]|nr:RNA polymerase sigma factor [Polyangia bacterium]
MDFEEKLVAFYPQLMPLAMRWCRNEADAHDLVQDAVEKGLRCRALFRTGDAPDRWLSTILRNLFVDGCRSGRRRAELLAFAQWPDFATPPLADADDRKAWESFTTQDVRRALLFVDAKSREVFSMFEFGNLDQREIARRLSISARTVATRIYRTREKLRKILASGQHRRSLALVRPVKPGSARAGERRPRRSRATQVQPRPAPARAAR